MLFGRFRDVSEVMYRSLQVGNPSHPMGKKSYWPARYVVYLAESAAGAHRSQLGLELPPERRFQQVGDEQVLGFLNLGWVLKKGRVRGNLFFFDR